MFFRKLCILFFEILKSVGFNVDFIFSFILGYLTSVPGALVNTTLINMNVVSLITNLFFLFLATLNLCFIDLLYQFK